MCYCRSVSVATSLFGKLVYICVHRASSSASLGRLGSACTASIAISLTLVNIPDVAFLAGGGGKWAGFFTGALVLPLSFLPGWCLLAASEGVELDPVGVSPVGA